MKISTLTENSTTAGAVAPVSEPFSAVVKREQPKAKKGSNLLKGIKTSAKYANSLHESYEFDEPTVYDHAFDFFREKFTSEKLNTAGDDRLVNAYRKYFGKEGQISDSDLGLIYDALYAAQNDSQFGALDETTEKQPDTDQILYFLTTAAQRIKNSPGYHEEDKTILLNLYEYLRDPLKAGDFEGFATAYDNILNKHPDAGSELIDCMYQAAGLGDNGTYEQFMDKAMNEGLVKEAFPHDVDHMPGATIKNPNSNCKRCNGYGYVYKSTDGKVLPSNEQGAKRYKCGACGGFGMAKKEVGEGAKVDRMVKHVAQSEKKAGHSDKEAENIAWATANKRGMLNNKNKKVEEAAAPWAANWKKAALASKKAQQSPSGANHARAAALHRHGAKDPWGPYKDKHIEAAEKHEKASKMYEGQEIQESDIVLAPGKGRQYKPGLLNKPEVSINPPDVVRVDVPLLIRLFEYAKEDAPDDMALHDLAEKLVAGSTRGRTMSMKDYDTLVPAVEPAAVQDEGLVGAALGGAAGAAITKSPSGAMTGAQLGSSVQDALTGEEVDEGKWSHNAITGQKLHPRTGEPIPGTPKPVKVPAVKAAPVNKDDIDSLVWWSLSTADGWGEMDSTDMITHKVLPAIRAAIRKEPTKYGARFAEAIRKASGEYGIFDQFYKYLDRAVKKYEGSPDFHSWVEQTEEGYRELVKGY